MKQFNSKVVTGAPKQIQFSRKLEAPISAVWAVVSNHRGMTQWIPMISHVELVQPDAHGTWGEGCERHCQFGSDLLHEKIVHWDPPYAYAYAIADMDLVKDHVGHIQLVEKLDGTMISWTQYYKPNSNFFKNWMAKNVLLPYVMKKALKNLNNSLLIQKHNDEIY